MKTKWRTLLSGGVGLTMILLTGNQPVAAAPAGEVKIAGPMVGNQVPIPRLELTHANDWMQLLYDHLLGCTPEGDFSPDHGLANRWEMSPDALTWTFYLRKGVKFHDGVEVTAKDVKFSLEEFIRPDSLSDDAAFLRRDIKSIEVKDSYTLVIQCKQPAIFLRNLLSNMEGTAGMIIPKDYYEKVGKEEFQKHPIGSGPYKWHSQMVGSFIKLEATEKHWRDGVPRYKYMTYLIIPEEGTRIAMLRTGEADITRVSRKGVKEARGAGLNIVTKKSGGIVVFYFTQSWTSPIFSDIRFRKALNLAIDRGAIIKRLLEGLADPIAAYPGSKISAVGGDPKLKAHPYDPQEARRLIKEGGWEGHEVTLISYDRAGFPELHEVIEALAGYWEKIGLKTKVNRTDWGVWRRARFEPKAQNTIYGSDDTVNPNAGALLIKFIERMSSKTKLATVHIRELDEKIERAEKSIDVDEVSKILADLYRYDYDHYLMIPICETFDEIATTKRIPKWDPGLRRMDRNYYDLIRQR